jgi:hypothetical protein
LPVKTIITGNRRFKAVASQDRNYRQLARDAVVGLAARGGCDPLIKGQLLCHLRVARAQRGDAPLRTIRARRATNDKAAVGHLMKLPFSQGAVLADATTLRVMIGGA